MPLPSLLKIAGRLQGFDDKVGTILKQIYPPTMMRDLEISSQEAIIELAQAFPYQPSAGAAGLSRFQQVRLQAVDSASTGSLLDAFDTLGCLWALPGTPMSAFPAYDCRAPVTLLCFQHHAPHPHPRSFSYRREVSSHVGTSRAMYACGLSFDSRDSLRCSKWQWVVALT